MLQSWYENYQEELMKNFSYFKSIFYIHGKHS